MTFGTNELARHDFDQKAAEVRLLLIRLGVFELDRKLGVERQRGSRRVVYVATKPAVERLK